MAYYIVCIILCSEGWLVLTDHTHLKFLIVYENNLYFLTFNFTTLKFKCNYLTENRET
jgi:hypothetical protein